jgi:hypothetical protein
MDRGAHDDVAAAVADLGEGSAVVTAFDGRRSYDLAHLAAVASSPTGAFGLYLVGFEGPLRGGDCQRLADELVATAHRLSGTGPELSLQDVL